MGRRDIQIRIVKYFHENVKQFNYLYDLRDKK